ncbi:DNA methyltransferase [Thermoflexus sp.]|uniref:DNA methyltransferase n=1 Tax=Thermoflexus sp. TaxID=1969742 RepID=UPI002ADE8915|nr:DNA methyltransferase [Thermoflexus sp.]
MRRALDSLQPPLMMTFPSPSSWMIRHMGAEGLRLERKYAVLIREEQRLGRLVSYVGNKEVPLLRLYRYKEAFAFRLVEELIARFGIGRPEDCVLDPFCGMGTTLLAAALRGIPAIGIDRLPVAVFIAQTLPLFFQIQPGEIRAAYGKLKRMLPRVPPAEIAEDVEIMKVAFPENTLQALRRWKAAIEALEPPLREIYRLLFFAILEPCSYTAKDGQFLRLRRSKKLASPDDALLAKVMEAEEDVLRIRALRWELREPSLWTAILGDTRNLHSISFPCAPTALITSPPYANRYDYTRTYSLELCFHFVRDFSELRALRHSLLRSHIEARLDPSEKAPHPAVQETVDFLKEQKASLNNPRIPEMLTAYFVDMRKAIQEWGRVLVPGARAAIVVDNVRFAGRLLPVDLILCEMSEEEGFQVEEILVARYKGNSSQQMGRYGRIPVRESILIWRKRP